MKLSTVTAMAVPLILLLVLLASTVITARLQEVPTGQLSGGAHITNLPGMTVTASLPEATGGTLARSHAPLATQWLGTDMMTCSWPAHVLRMPYYSFADSLISRSGI